MGAFVLYYNIIIYYAVFLTLCKLCLFGLGDILRDIRVIKIHISNLVQTKRFLVTYMQAWINP